MGKKSFPGSSDGKESATMQEIWVRPLVGKIPWRREWQSSPVFLPGESHGQRSLVGYSPGGRKESDTTERLTQGGKGERNKLGNWVWHTHIYVYIHICKIHIHICKIDNYQCESWTIKKVECRRSNALNCGTGEDPCESLGHQGDQTSQS